MQVHCPECSHAFSCQVAVAGQLLACPSCEVQFKISAKETVLYLDAIDSSNDTAIVNTQAGETLEADQLKAGDRLDGYRIERAIGRGGMGIVFLATQLSLSKQVAIKVLPAEQAKDDEFIRRFHRETRALAELQHPHIISVIDKGCYRGIYYFVMEYVEGVTLRDLLKERKLTADEALRIVPQVCGALEYAHSRGVIHRDIKPENIILDRHGNANIADFGLSKIVGEHETVAITRTDAVMGTFDYMAPEQRAGTAGVDHRADLYSLGVVLYEMLTGTLPAGNFEPPSKCNAEFTEEIDRIVMRVLERDPARRYQKASEIASDVQRFADRGERGSDALIEAERTASGRLVLALPASWENGVSLVRGLFVQYAWWFFVAIILLIVEPGGLFGWCIFGAIIWFWHGVSYLGELEKQAQKRRKEREAAEEAARKAAADAARRANNPHAGPEPPRTTEEIKRAAEALARQAKGVATAAAGAAARAAAAKIQAKAAERAARAEAKAEAKAARAEAKAARAEAKGELDEDGQPINGKGSLSACAILSAIYGVPIAIGGLALVLFNHELLSQMVALELLSQTGLLVGIAAAALLPLGILLLARAGRRAVAEGRRGGTCAMIGLLCGLMGLGGVGHLWGTAFDQLLTWRSFDRLAARGDLQTLQLLESEFTHPRSDGTRTQAARMLVTYAPTRALALGDTTDGRKLAALLDAYLSSKAGDSQMAATVAGKYLLHGDVDAYHSTGYQAFRLVRKHRPESALPALGHLLDSQSRTASMAANALSGYRSEAAVPLLGRAAIHPDLSSGSRSAAIRALAKIGTPAAAAQLLATYVRGEQYHSREAEKELVRLLGPAQGSGVTQRATAWATLIKQLNERAGD